MRTVGPRVWFSAALVILLAVAAVVSALQGDWLIAAIAAALIPVQLWQVRKALLRSSTEGERPPDERGR